MNIFLKKIAAVFVFICVVLAGQAVCRVEASGESHVVDEDFGYKGVLLGGSEEDMLKIMGEADYDRKDNIFGTPVKRYEYGDIAISVAPASKRVVDIELKGKDFQVRGGIRYGSTAFWINSVYGKQEKQQIDGYTCYIYARPGHKHEHLLLRTDSEKGILVSMRITALPLTDEEADQMVIDGSDIELGLVTEEELSADTKIDLSALPQSEEPKLVLGEAQ